ncbi:MAG: Ig-like domain-containing protein [Methanobacteriota archaeon]
MAAAAVLPVAHGQYGSPPLANQPPVIAFATPAEGANLPPGIVTISGEARDEDPDDAVAVVEFMVNGVTGWTPAVGVSPWTATWDTGPSASGDYVVNARASDGTAYSPVVAVAFTVGSPALPPEPELPVEGAVPSETGGTPAAGPPAGTEAPEVPATGPVAVFALLVLAAVALRRSRP